MAQVSPSYSPKIAAWRARRDFARGAWRAIASEDDDAAAGFDFAWLEVSTKGSMRRRRRDGYGPAAQSRPASARKTARSGHAVGKKTRMRAAPSTTRAAILISRRRIVANSAYDSGERYGAAARMVSRSQ